MKRLEQIVCIRSGYTMRKPPKGIVPRRPYPMIQIKDIADKWLQQIEAWLQASCLQLAAGAET